MTYYLSINALLLRSFYILLSLFAPYPLCLVLLRGLVPFYFVFCSLCFCNKVAFSLLPLFATMLHLILLALDIA